MENIAAENEMLRTKLRSFHTLNMFYSETHNEIATLRHQIYTKDNIIGDLKARLGRYEESDVHLEGDGPLVFGPSKSLLDSLCKEVAELKQKLTDSDIKAAHQLETNKLEIHTLQQQIKEKDWEILRITHRPGHEKDLEIQQLQRALAERHQAQATGAVLCSSLAEEADQLRAKLRATVGVCEELLKRLGEKQTPSQGSGESADSTKDAQHSPLLGEIEEENKLLRQRVAYVESLNAKWQKYDSSREEYVKGLCQKLKESNVLADLRPARDSILQQEILRLNCLLEEKMRECSELGRSLEDVRKQDRERIQMLEQQVLIYVDDFKNERADRERAQYKVQSLEEEVLHLKLQLHVQDSNERTETRQAHAGHGNTELLPKGTADRPGAWGSGGKPARRAAQTQYEGRMGLQCPRCLTLFNNDQTVEFLNHCTECAHT